MNWPTFQECVAPWHLRTYAPGLLESLCLNGDLGVFGGAVRQAVLGVPTDDLDLVSTFPGRVLQERLRPYPATSMIFWEGNIRETRPTEQVPLYLRFFRVYTPTCLIDVMSLPDVHGIPEGVRPRTWGYSDFTCNAAVVWNDGQVSEHPDALRDLQSRTLRVLRPRTATQDQIQKFQGMGFRLVTDTDRGVDHG